MCASCVIYLLDVLAVSRWSNQCVLGCCVPIITGFNLVPAKWLNFDLVTTG